MAGARAKNPKLSTSTRNLLEFFDHLEEYTKRHLTYDSDSHNAFRGLLAISYFHTFWGVPIARMDSDGKDYFNIGLRPGFVVEERLQTWVSPSTDGISNLVMGRLG
jgi:hypothetical protein